MRLRLLWLPVCAVLVAAPLAHAASCGTGDLERFVERAQRGEKAAVATGQALLSCPRALGVSERAVQWLAFLYAFTGDQAKARAVDLPEPPSGARGPEGVLGRARSGLYRELLGLVDAETPGYATSAEAQLVLARAATRKGAFDRGREAYRVYLSLKPADDDAVCEQLYTWLWQGDYAEAQQQLAEAARYGGSPSLRACIERGASLARSRGGGRATAAGPSAEDAEAGYWRLDLSTHQVPDLWRRQTARAGHYGPVGLQLAGHALSLDALGNAASRATEARAGGRYLFAETFGVAAEVGFWSPGTRNGFGSAELSLHLPWDLRLAGGARREPLALSVPLVPEARGLMRDTAYLAAGAGPYAELQLSVRKEDDLSAHELHTLLLRLPVQRAGKGDYTSLRAPLAAERHPRPSPHYIADVRTDSIGFGVEMARPLGGRLESKLVVDYSLAFSTLRDPEASRERHGHLDAQLRLAARLVNSCRVHLDGSYHRADDEDAGRRRMLANSLGLGLSCLD
jgi:hypothetical protein